MAKYAPTQHRLQRTIRLVALLMAMLVLCASLVACDFFEYENPYGADGKETAAESSKHTGGGEEEQSDQGTGDTDEKDREVEFHFLDAGQGDAAIICTPQGVVLIDTSTGSFETKLKAYLSYYHITTIDYAIFTHPHEDHIGGADMIMQEFDVKNVLIPNCTSTTKTFRNMMSAIEASDAELIIPNPGYTFSLGEVKMEVLAPLDKYDDANNASIVLRVDYGETSVLFTGDAEVESEADMLKKYKENGRLDCDLLKVGHHGSYTSSSAAFLIAVSPEYAVISCGEGNEYGHPHAATTERLQAYNVAISRTDREGTVVFISDGQTLRKQTYD